MKKIVKFINEKYINKKNFIILFLVFVLAFGLNSSLNQLMAFSVRVLPPTTWWSYESITPLKSEYKVGDLIEFETKNERSVKMRLIFQDYLYCNSDETDKYRYLYTSTFLGGKGKVQAVWTYGKTDISDGYKLEETGEGCYILSEQIGFPYGEEIYQSYKSGPFNIVE